MCWNRIITYKNKNSHKNCIQQKIYDNLINNLVEEIIYNMHKNRNFQIVILVFECLKICYEKLELHVSIGPCKYHQNKNKYNYEITVASYQY